MLVKACARSESFSRTEEKDEREEFSGECRASVWVDCDESILILGLGRSFRSLLHDRARAPFPGEFMSSRTERLEGKAVCNVTDHTETEAKTEAEAGVDGDTDTDTDGKTDRLACETRGFLQ